MPPHYQASQKTHELTTRKRPLKVPAMVFLALVCLSFVMEVAWSRWDAFRMQLKEKEIATSNMTRALAQHAENTVQAADTVLVGLVERLESSGLHEANRPGLHKLLKRHVSELPMLQAVFLFDEHGRQFVNSQQPLPNNTDGSLREYFIFHRNNTTPDPHIAPPQRSVVTADWIIPLTRRINHPDGSFAGVAVANIRLQHFKQYYDSFDIGQQGTILLVLDNGELLVRRAPNETTNRLDIADGPLFREYQANGPVGSAMLTAHADNIERLYSYRHVDGFPLLMATGLAKKEILANWWRDTWRNVCFVALMVAGLGLSASRLVRQLDLRDQLEFELREAKLTLETLNGSLKTLALHDALTGLANRRQFETALETELSRATRDGTSLALVMLDVDYFKQYNDLYGHPAGDECLRKIGGAIRMAQHRAGDLAVRYGGEEFAVLLPRTDLAGAMAVAEKIRSAVGELALPHAANPAGVVTISAGVEAVVPARSGNGALELVQAADTALYAAKSNGRNCVHGTAAPGT